MTTQINTFTKRSEASVNAYLILRREDEILLLLRKNTNYCDGMWGFVAGHVEDGESATEAMIREAKEEIGIQLLPHQIKVVHIMHRQSNRMNIDVFFECLSWEGMVKNCEPEKCEKLDFFPTNTLPANLIEYNIHALHATMRGEYYSEQGWSA